MKHSNRILTLGVCCWMLFGSILLNAYVINPEITRSYSGKVTSTQPYEFFIDSIATTDEVEITWSVVGNPVTVDLLDVCNFQAYSLKYPYQTLKQYSLSMGGSESYTYDLQRAAGCDSGDNNLLLVLVFTLNSGSATVMITQTHRFCRYCTPITIFLGCIICIGITGIALRKKYHEKKYANFF